MLIQLHDFLIANPYICSCTVENLATCILLRFTVFPISLSPTLSLSSLNHVASYFFSFSSSLLLSSSQLVKKKEVAISYSYRVQHTGNCFQQASKIIIFYATIMYCVHLPRSLLLCSGSRHWKYKIYTGNIKTDFHMSIVIVGTCYEYVVLY